MPWLPTEQVGRDADTLLPSTAPCPDPCRSVAWSGSDRSHGRGLSFQGRSCRARGQSLGSAGAAAGAARGRIRGHGLSAEGRVRARWLEAVARYQPSGQGARRGGPRGLGRPAGWWPMPIDYVAVRWEGRPEEAHPEVEGARLARGDRWGRLVVLGAHGGCRRSGGASSAPVSIRQRLLPRPAARSSRRAGRHEPRWRGARRSRSGPEPRMLEHVQAVVDSFQRFEFVYPFVMAGVWVAGAVFFWWLEERGGRARRSLCRRNALARRSSCPATTRRPR